jgi:hypothetical protein
MCGTVPRLHQVPEGAQQIVRRQANPLDEQHDLPERGCFDHRRYSFVMSDARLRGELEAG